MTDEPTPLQRPARPSGLKFATRLVKRICRVAGDHRLIDHVIRNLARRGVRAAVRQRDTAVLYDWLLETVSHQGISDHVAWGFSDCGLPVNQPPSLLRLRRHREARASLRG